MVQKITKDNELLALSKEVYNALQTYAVVNHPKFGKIYAFEIDGFGSAYLSDDANVPNLLALPYLGGVDRDDAIYANTRRFVWSEYNPYFFKGSYFEGIGGHHIGTDMIWPMSLIMKALTAQDDKELQQCIQMSRKRMPVPGSCTSRSTRMIPRNSQGAGLHGPIHCLENCCGKHSMRNLIYWNINHLINQCKQKFMKRITKFSLLLSLVLGLYFPTVFAQSNMTNEMFDLAKLKSGVKNKRISSTDPTGGNRDHLEPFKPGEKRIIADIKGTGVINHIWVTIAPPPPTLSRNDIIIRMYWDGTIILR